MVDGSGLLPERWVDVVEFPGYSISDWGRVLYTRTGIYIKATKTSRGSAMVGLMRNGIQYKRSLSLMVASVFVPRQGEGFDTPINRDGDRFNNHYANLAWRPLWFARKYNQQFTDGHPTCELPVEDVETGEVYENSMHASVFNGVLDFEIFLSMTNNTYVWPTGQIFRIVT